MDYVSDSGNFKNLEDPLNSTNNLTRIRVKLDKQFLLDESSNLVIAILETEPSNDGSTVSEVFYYTDQAQYQTIGFNGNSISDFSDLSNNPPSASLYYTRLNDIDFIGPIDDGLEFLS